MSTTPATNGAKPGTQAAPAKPGTPATTAKPAPKGKPGRKPVDPNETATESFRRLAVARVNKAVKAIQSIGNLSASSYESDPLQVEKIYNVLTDELIKSRGRFDKRKDGGKTSFSL